MEMDSAEPCHHDSARHEMDEPIDVDDTDIDIEIPDIVIGDAFEESVSGEQQYIPEFDIEGDVKLYEGSSLSCLQTVSLLLSWFSSSPGVSKHSLSSLLNLLHTHILPSVARRKEIAYARAISFALCADGLNPFAHEKTQYSMCPLFLIPLNFPHHIRKKAGAMFLTGIIPGHKEPKNMDPYIDLIVDDIMSLNSVNVYDAHMGEDFKLKANILLHVLDYPGQNKLFKSQGKDLLSYILATIP